LAPVVSAKNLHKQQRSRMKNWQECCLTYVGAVVHKGREQLPDVLYQGAAMLLLQVQGSSQPCTAHGGEAAAKGHKQLEDCGAQADTQRVQALQM
jgi:hypothetical protein